MLFRSRTIGDATSATTGLTDIYAVKLDVNEGFHAATITGNSAISQYVPDFTKPGAVKEGEVEMVAATVPFYRPHLYIYMFGYAPYPSSVPFADHNCNQ